MVIALKLPHAEASLVDEMKHDVGDNFSDFISKVSFLGQERFMFLFLFVCLVFPRYFAATLPFPSD